MMPYKPIPTCPYCGGKMMLIDTIAFSMYECGKCRSRSPYVAHETDLESLVNARQSAYAAAMQRAEPQSVVRMFADKDENLGADGWVSVDKDMPPEHDSMFAKFYGTPRWDKAMWRKMSDEVIVTIKLEDGSKRVTTSRTHDGAWKAKSQIIKETVISWMPLPEAAPDAQRAAAKWEG